MLATASASSQILFGRVSDLERGQKVVIRSHRGTELGVVLVKIIPTGMPAYYRGTAPDALSNVMLTGINIPIRLGNATVMPGDVVLGDEEGLFFIPPHLVKASIDAAQSTMARDEWIKSKMDLRQYKSSDLYGRPRDPALLKEMEEYIRTHQKTKD